MNTHAVFSMRGRAGRYAATALGAGVVLALGVLAPAAAQAAAPATLYVSQGGSVSAPCTKANPCATVSDALTVAASGATVEVTGKIDDHPVIKSPVTITTWPGGVFGPGVLDGTANGAVVGVNPGVTGVTLRDLTIQDGTAGINNGGTLTLTDSTVSGNLSFGGIDNGGNGTMTVIDSTISGNKAVNSPGGGIYNQGGGTVTVIASTISGNTGTNGVGIYTSGIVTLGATIVAGNTGGNCVGGAANIQSVGYNLTDDTTGAACHFTTADFVNKKPLLGSLASNGGPTQTLLPGAKSPAANVIPTGTTLRGVAVCPGTDQRGVARPGHGETGCTIGAVEAALTKATTTSVTLNPAKVTAGTRVVYVAAVTPKSGTGTPAGTISFSTGSTKLCTAVLSGGAAACGATSAPAGTDTVTGTYSGGGGYASSSGTAILTVTP